MAYGSPDRIEDVPAYYADIRGGRPIRPELLDDLVARYRRLGIEESNPLNEITEATRAGLEAGARPARLHRDAPLAAADRGRGRARARRRRRDDRRARARAALLLDVDREVPQPCSRTRSATEPSCASSSAGATSRASSSCSPSAWQRSATSESHVVFTAHSLPARILDEGDPYVDELNATAEAVARRAGLDDWSFSFQSESPTGEPWLGPDILDHLDELAAQGVRDVVLCPVGFVADHLEIRWDLDTEAVERAQELGLALRRIEMPNADPAFVRVLAGLRSAAPLAVPSEA